MGKNYLSKPLTLPMAYALNQSLVWKLGMSQFLRG